MNAVMHDQARIRHQLRHLADAADILDAVGLGKAQILVEAVAHIVAIQQEGVPVHPVQLLLDLRLAMVDLPEPESPVNHSTAGFWFLSARARRG
jgi:hypothetical protein